MGNIKKIETIEEFLARGGEIQKVPTQKYSGNNIVRKTKSGPAQILNYGDADLYYGEKNERKKKKRDIKLDGIDLGLIDDNLLKNLGIKPKTDS